MEEKRISPEKALEIYNKEKRGKLKIYMGYSPGVGKTYTMLREANIRVKRGEEIYIAYLEPHDRKATLEQVGILKEISPLEIEYRGKVYKEVDVKAVIEKHPKTVLIDELAHTNIFGSKNKKRYEDVLEILEVGINVNTTLNIQHIESLNDIVQTITGIEVRERIPDKIVNLADEVEVVDISASNLTERLQRGEIYNLKTAASALKNFFQIRKS